MLQALQAIGLLVLFILSGCGAPSSPPSLST